MVYFSLPYFFEDYNFNLFLQNYIEKNPNKINFPCKIDSLYGNFPFSFWYVDVNNCLYTENLVLFDEMSYFQANNIFPIYLDISNKFLTSTDLNDVHLNTVLKIFEGTGNYIKIIDKEIYKYIKKKYIGYNFILSENYFIFEKEKTEANNDILDLVDLIELPAYMNLEKDFLLKYPNKNKISLTLGDNCKNCDFSCLQSCRERENNVQAIFSKNSVYYDCEDGFNYNSLFEEFNELKLLGYSKFKIKAPLFTNLKEYHKNLIKFFIKPEFQLDFLVDVEEVLW